LNKLNEYESNNIDLHHPNFIFSGSVQNSSEKIKKRTSSACKSRKQQLISDYKKMNAHSNLKHKQTLKKKKVFQDSTPDLNLNQVPGAHDNEKFWPFGKGSNSSMNYFSNCNKSTD
jgi:hypothetical protein